MLCNPNFRASGNILPSYFVMCDPGVGENWKVLQAASGSIDYTNAPIGISQEGTRNAPIPGASAYAAVDEDPIQVYGQGDVCLLTIGVGGCTAGNLLKSDATGKGIVLAASALQYYGARALETCIADDLCRVQVTFGAVTVP